MTVSEIIRSIKQIENECYYVRDIIDDIWCIIFFKIWRGNVSKCLIAFWPRLYSFDRSWWVMKKSILVRLPGPLLLRYRIFTIFFNKLPWSLSGSLKNRLSNFDLKLCTNKGLDETSLFWKFQIFWLLLS